MAFSLESQQNRENPFFSMFLEIVLRLQREHSLEGTKEPVLIRNGKRDYVVESVEYLVQESRGLKENERD